MPPTVAASAILGVADEELAQSAFADLDPGFAAKVTGEYGIAAAGRNFGGGKTIEGPVFALRGAGVKLVIADSTALEILNAGGWCPREAQARPA